MTLKVNEIFFSIQGESTYAGLPCIFIRLTGCNLRCSYCDTRYAYSEGSNMSIADIAGRAAAYPPSALIEITGGEPLFQEKTPELIRHFLDTGRTVLMETNGSFDISRVDPRCIRIMDVKCPSSRMQDRNDPANLARIGPCDQLKFIIGNRTDYEFALKTIQQTPAGFPRSSCLFSPAFGLLPPERLAEWILEDGIGVRLHLQLHKVIWPHRDRGV